MGDRIKPSDPRLYQVKLIAKLDETEEGRSRKEEVRRLVADLVLLGKQRGRPSLRNRTGRTEEETE